MPAQAEFQAGKTSVDTRETNFLEGIDAARIEAATGLNPKKQRTFGQFFTPLHIAQMLSAMVETRGTGEVSLLDAGAGTGILTAACVFRLCNSEAKPRKIAVTAIELDEELIPTLRQTLEACRKECDKHKVKLTFEILNEDFIAFVAQNTTDLFSEARPLKFDIAIINPPYNKINADSTANKFLCRREINAPNYYAAFLALSADLLEPNGELIAITPRSFCNGAYFKPFRPYFLERMSFTAFHLFESRKEVFDSDILQENIIFRAVKNKSVSRDVTVSVSHNGNGVADRTITLTHDQLVSPSDKELYIHLGCDDSGKNAASPINHFQTSLESLGLKASTGRVVDFRNAQYLCKRCNDSACGNSAEAAPLIYPHNIAAGKVDYPVPHPKKFDSLRINSETTSQFVENGTYVLVKRFSAKEEKRRITAALYEKTDAPGDKVGFENHLNYFHAGGREIEPQLAKGLTIYLNSGVLDDYFRRFSGHTQVNATDLRYLKYPTKKELEELGKHFTDALPSHAEIDELIAQIVDR